MPLDKKPPKIDGISRYWATEIYSDKIVRIDMCLRKLHIPCMLSPKHDKDVKEHIDTIEDREYLSFRIKKPHYHLLCIFPHAVGVKSFHAELYHKLYENGIDTVGYELVRSEVGYARYLAHLDNPEKYQYDKEEILYYGGANPYILEMTEKNKVDNCIEMNELTNIIINTGIDNLIDLKKYLELVDADMIPSLMRLDGKLERWVKANNFKSQRIKTIKQCQEDSRRIHHDKYAVV